MNVYHRAYQQTITPNWTRIDMLLALFDGTIDRLEKGLARMRKGDEAAAMPYLARAQLLVLELAAGINFDIEDAASPNLLRLYEFIAQSIASKKMINLETSLRVLETLREGFAAIRSEAVEMERTGLLPPIGSSALVLATA